MGIPPLDSEFQVPGMGGLAGTRLVLLVLVAKSWTFSVEDSGPGSVDLYSFYPPIQSEETEHGVIVEEDTDKDPGFQVMEDDEEENDSKEDGVEKRTPYSYGLGKRSWKEGTLGFKRAPYGYGLGKRAPYSYGLGKRDPYGYGLGKRDPYGYGLGKREPYAYGLGKREPYAYGLGKRDPYAYGLGKRGPYSYGLGKRNST